MYRNSPVSYRTLTHWGRCPTSDTGSQYCCKRVGRGIQPPSTPQVPHSPTQKASKTLILALFDSSSRTDLLSNMVAYRDVNVVYYSLDTQIYASLPLNSLKMQKKQSGTDRQTDRQTDRPTDRQTDIATYRAAIAAKNKKYKRLKNLRNLNDKEN